MSKRLEIINFQRGILSTIKEEVDSVTDGCEVLATMLDEGKLLRLHADSEDDESGKVFAESSSRLDSAEELAQALLSVCALKRDPRIRLQAAASLLALIVSTVHDDPSIVSLLALYSVADALNTLGDTSSSDEEGAWDDVEGVPSSDEDDDWDKDDASSSPEDNSSARGDDEDGLPPAESNGADVIQEYKHITEDGEAS